MVKGSRVVLVLLVVTVGVADDARRQDDDDEDDPSWKQRPHDKQRPCCSPSSRLWMHKK